MNVFLKELIILIIGNLLISTVSCESTLELACTTNADCKSYENKFIFSECDGEGCICQNRKDERWEPCAPTGTSVINEEVDEPPCRAPNTEFRYGECRTKNVHLGKACDDAIQCERVDWNSDCVKKVCTCKEHYMEVDKECRSIVNVEKCAKRDDCPANSDCVKDKCVCQKEFIGSIDKSKCLPLRAYNETCEESQQCTMKFGQNSFCKKGICQCKNNHAAVEQNGAITCIRNAFVGDRCYEEDECFNEKLVLTCVDLICVCKKSSDHYAADVTSMSSCQKKDSHALPLKSGAASIKVFKMFSVIVIFSVFFAL